MTLLRKITFNKFDEEVHYTRLKNGLDIFIIPKTGFKEKTAMLTVDFGSVDKKFTLRNRLWDNPEGIAHFLEHKLFEDVDGEDVSLKFTQLGADVNAFTTFDKTSYYFSTSENFIESLTLLQELVMSASFTEESVNKEKKIIAQEIDMYADDADYQAYIGILQNLFSGTSLADDIAGSKESINQITTKILKRNYNYFYKPNNMNLLIVGDVDIEETYSAIETYQKKFRARKQVERIDDVIYNPVVKSNSKSMEIMNSKLVVGFRGQKVSNNLSLLTIKIALRLAMSMLFGWTSKTYQTWYEQGKIDDSFDIEIEINNNFSFVLISLDTNQPIGMSSEIRKKIKNCNSSDDFNQEHFAILKREMYGDFLQSLDNVEQIASQFNLFLTNQDTYYDIPDILESIQLDEVLTIAEDFFKQAEESDFTVFPK
ncbi:EF-P 5-aminopentanol modification-associated protein YfmH [Streptococcus hongkongensis]